MFQTHPMPQRRFQPEASLLRRTLELLLFLPLAVAAATVSDQVQFPDPEKIPAPQTSITGDLRQWHKVTLTIDGPRASQYGRTVFLFNETTSQLDLDVQLNAGPGGRLSYMHPNPFLDFRMTVTFTHESGTPSYQVPGYFAADGDAANTGAHMGNQWRAHLSPDKTGRWGWKVSFLAGVDVAIDDNVKGQPYLPYDGLSGSFEIETTDKSFPDFRAMGRLQYVGERYLQFAGSGDIFLKAGADAPETLLAYVDFDGTRTMMVPGERGWIGPRDGHGLHEYAAHRQDWREGDPAWKDGKGKGLIGGINYLASKGMNAMSFLVTSAGGDGENVWPWVDRNDPLHYHVAKLAQWETVFEHAQQRGLFLHFKLQENENDSGYPHRLRWKPRATAPEALDHGTLGKQRKLFTREVIARFGHHLALNWNLGEESMVRPEWIKEWGAYIDALDPYKHHRVLHSAPAEPAQTSTYEPLLGDAKAITGVSLQTHYDNVHRDTLRWLKASKESGHIWAVANDEQGPAVWATPPDPRFQNWEDTLESPIDIHDIRKNALWGVFMAGGWGIEYYFGYRPVHNDLVAEDWRSRDMTWNFARHALTFFREHSIPVRQMENHNALIPANDEFRGYCFAKPDELYLVYYKTAAAPAIDLSGTSGTWDIRWYDPRNGGELRSGSISSVSGGSVVDLGKAPDAPDQDWLIYLRKR